MENIIFLAELLDFFAWSISVIISTSAITKIQTPMVVKTNPSYVQFKSDNYPVKHTLIIHILALTTAPILDSYHNWFEDF